MRTPALQCLVLGFGLAITGCLSEQEDTTPAEETETAVSAMWSEPTPHGMPMAMPPEILDGFSFRIAVEAVSR